MAEEAGGAGCHAQKVACVQSSVFGFGLSFVSAVES